MHPFFDLIERVGLNQNRLAARMGYSEAHFSKVKQGVVPITPKFENRSVAVLGEIGLRKPDGREYDRADLFLPSLVVGGTKMVLQETKEADHVVA